MKKILFEQIGNIIMVLLLVLAMVQSIHSARIETSPLSFSVEIGFYWMLFFIWIIIFGICRLLYSNKNKGYNTRKGELSTEDEREELISQKAITITYKAIIVLLIVLLFLNFGLSLFITEIKTFQVMVIISIGISLLTGFITYLSAWVIFDNRI